MIAALRELLTNRQVKTVSLGGPLPRPVDQRAKPGSASDSSTLPRQSGPSKENNAPTTPEQAPVVGKSEPELKARPKKPLDLDELVDQLDLLDQ